MSAEKSIRVPAWLATLLVGAFLSFQSYLALHLTLLEQRVARLQQRMEDLYPAKIANHLRVEPQALIVQPQIQ
jgi:hypothetical protein